MIGIIIRLIMAAAIIFIVATGNSFWAVMLFMGYISIELIIMEETEEEKVAIKAAEIKAHEDAIKENNEYVN